MQINRRYFILISLLLVSTTALLILFHDNTDHATRSFRTEKGEVRMLSLKGADFLKAITKEFEEKMSQLIDFMEEKGKAEKGKCLKNPDATDDVKQQLQSFIEGECAPIILIPGLISTKLMVTIDCDLLQEHHPEIMEACGWSTCSWSLLHKKPASEYILWIPSFTSALSMVTKGNSSTCFGHFVKPRYNASAENIREKYQYPTGVKVTWYGNTPKTRSKADGGLSAISDLLPLHHIQILGTKKFGVWTKYLKELGYQRGLTLFGIPYNFLQTYWANEVSYTLERTIRYAYELTGKKVILIAHSLGNLNTLAALNRMSQEDKDRMVAVYTAIAPPFGGAAQALRDSLGGDPAYQYGFDIGVNFYNQASFIGGSSSIQDLLPKDLFYRFSNQTWLQDLLNRSQLEEKYNVSTSEGRQYWEQAGLKDLPYSFFPNPSETCFEEFNLRDSHCMIGITNLKTEPIARVAKEFYYANVTSIQEMVQKHYNLQPLDVFNGMWNDSLKAGIENFTNPGVPIVYFYGSHLPTERRYEWDEPPEKNTSQEEFALPSKAVKGNGDGTVEVSFTLPIAFKWAWENINLGNTTNAKPIKIVEFCSSYNKSGPIWDDHDANGTRIMTTTNYAGVSCHCRNVLPTDGKNCFHAQMVNDPHVSDLVREIATTNETVSNKNATHAFKLSRGALCQLKKDLPSLTRPQEEQDVTAWFQNPDEC